MHVHRRNLWYGVSCSGKQRVSHSKGLQPTQPIHPCSTDTLGCYTSYFGIGNTPFVRLFVKARVSTDVYGMEHGMTRHEPWLWRRG
jgi:hypothetical protein